MQHLIERFRHQRPHPDGELRFLIERSPSDFRVHLLVGDPTRLGFPADDSFDMRTIVSAIAFDNGFSRITGKPHYRRFLWDKLEADRTQVFLVPFRHETVRWALLRTQPLEAEPSVLHGELLHLSESEPYPLKLFRLAHLDDPTGLFNRQALRLHLEQIDTRADYHALFIDLDGFKRINDTHGHLAGDAVMQSIARRFRSLDDEAATFYRIGGDEFVVLLKGCKDEGVLDYTRRLNRSLRDLPVPGGTMSLTASIGVLNLAHVTDGFDALIRRSDEAMYAAKTQGGDSVHILE